ncbi:hypothetical protein, partial [Tuanshanicoccus yangjingiae]|uniref:hypothetical protein n=1 Tax=Aerococcaceae bacterium zg-252 TaxID=2796928 RepID=UPI00406433C7
AGLAGKSNDQAFNYYYSRLSSRMSKMKARIATAHKLLRIIFKILGEGVHYNGKRALGTRQSQNS